MIHAAVVIAYFGMLIFDAFVLAGAVWLIGWHGWSAWWMLVACIMCAGSAPNLMMKRTTGAKPEQK